MIKKWVKKLFYLIDLSKCFLAKLAEDIEKNLMLIGATAIEDKLQVGVPATIRDLLVAS